MKIIKFQFEDKSEGWKLAETSFNDSLTLLVGASGVGKTLILRALRQMKLIAEGKSYKGAKWNIEYIADDGTHHNWQGAFQNHGLSDSNWREPTDRSNYSKIEYEWLIINGKTIVERNTDGIIFDETPTQKLSPQESILNLFREEEKIKPAWKGIRKIDYKDHTFSAKSDLSFSNFDDFYFVDFCVSLMQKSESSDCLADIRNNNNWPLATRLCLAHDYHKETFGLIKGHFISIFPQVTEIRVSQLEDNDNNLIPYMKEGLFVQIQEEGIDHWIWPNRISSGMYRTLMQLCDLYLCADGTVFLIDEFENSLGINCIREITQDIISQERDLQFIVTSHHPYIINNIDPDYWKLVTRNGGVVKTHSLKDFGCDFKKSHHDTFMQLLQLEEFQTGQEAGK
jgi:hypothetical protein